VVGVLLSRLNTTISADAACAVLTTRTSTPGTLAIRQTAEVDSVVITTTTTTTTTMLLRMNRIPHSVHWNIPTWT
jgi:hypothetical protein